LKEKKNEMSQLFSD